MAECKEERKLPVLLSIKQCANELHLPYQFINQLVKDGKVLSFKSGNKNWVNFRSLCSYLEGENNESDSTL